MTSYKIRKEFLDIEQYDKDWMPENLIDAINWLQQKLSEIPVDMRTQATIEIDTNRGHYDSNLAGIIITGVRDETEEERIEREARQIYYEQQMRKSQQVQERALYEALKRK